MPLVFGCINLGDSSQDNEELNQLEGRGDDNNDAAVNAGGGQPHYTHE